MIIKTTQNTESWNVHIKLNFLKRKNHGLIDLVLKNFNENILSSDLFGRLQSSLEVQSSREGVATQKLDW